MAHSKWKPWLNILSWMRKLNENRTYKSGVQNTNTKEETMRKQKGTKNN